MVHLLEVNALNVEKDMNLLPSIKFLAHNTRRRLLQLEGRLAGNGCSLRSKFPHQEIRKWHEGGLGMFARRVGNILQAFKSDIKAMGKQLAISVFLTCF